MNPARVETASVLQPLHAVVTLVGNLIGPHLDGTEIDTPRRANGTWITFLCLGSALALLLIAAGHGAGRRGEGATASLLFWSGVILLVLPTASRAAWSAVARSERLFLLLLLSESLIIYNRLYAPTGFVQFDELLHWITAYDILHRHQLFLNNSLLPISPFFPGMEILTAAFASLTKLSIFAASECIIVVLRATFVTALFLFFDKICGSSRTAALACLVYMGSSTFVDFDSIFAYETLGLVLAMLAMLAEAEAARQQPAAKAGMVAFITMLLASLAVTHHLSAFFCAAYFAGLLGLEAVRQDDDHRTPRLMRLGVPAAAALLAVALLLLWVVAIGNPLSGYLGPVIQSGVHGLLAKLDGSSAARQMFVGADGAQQPLGYRLASIASTLLLAGGLATGFFRSLALGAAGPATSSGWRRLATVARREWRDSRIILLTLAAFGFPVSVAFRLTSAGWEIGNRMQSFVFVAVGLVVAVGITHFWQARITRRNLIATSLAIGTIVLGGLATGSGGRAVRGHYRVGADPESIEPMGINAAIWAREWLGEGNRFAADRVNRTLLATYGQQQIVTTINDGVDEARTFLGNSLSPDTLYPIRQGRIEYLLVDLRLTTARAVLGAYYEKGEPGNGWPPPPSSLLKFGGSDRVGRVFDNGWIVMFDVRGLRATD